MWVLCKIRNNIGFDIPHGWVCLTWLCDLDMKFSRKLVPLASIWCEQSMLVSIIFYWSIGTGRCCQQIPPSKRILILNRTFSRFITLSVGVNSSSFFAICSTSVPEAEYGSKWSQMHLSKWSKTKFPRAQTNYRLKIISMSSQALLFLHKTLLLFGQKC